MKGGDLRRFATRSDIKVLICSPSRRSRMVLGEKSQVKHVGTAYVSCAELHRSSIVHQNAPDIRAGGAYGAKSMLDE
jgi:hypothetical protein